MYAYSRQTVGIAATLVLLVLPAALKAQTFKDIVNNNVLPIFDSAITFIMTIAVLAFVFGAAKFVLMAGDDKSRSEGKQMMLWGIISLAVMVSIWGLVQIIKTTFFG